MTLINIDALPKEVEGPLAELEAALATRRDLQRRSAESAAAEPAAERALEAARAALDDAEMEFALASDEDEKSLRQTRDRRRREFQNAEEFLQRIRQLRRGITKRTENADAEILSAKAPFEAACLPFCDEVLKQYRDLLQGSVYGREAGGIISYASALQLGYALHDTLPFTRSLRSMLEQVKIPDIGPAPGRPVPHFIQGDRSWPSDDEVAGSSLRHWQDDAEIVALHAVLKPLGATYREATVRVRQIEAARLAAPAPAAPPAPPKANAEEREPTLEEHRAIMRGYRERPKGITPPARHTYSEPYSKPDRFDGTTLA